MVPWLLSALLVSALAAGRAEAAAAAPADEPIIRNTHHTRIDKQDSRIWHTEKRDFPLNKITSFKVTAGKPQPSISLMFVDAEGDEVGSHGGPDDWMITRDGDSTSLFRLLADSAPTDQDLFEVDWENEWKPRLRAARDRFHAKSEPPRRARATCGTTSRRRWATRSRTRSSTGRSRTAAPRT